MNANEARNQLGLNIRTKFARQKLSLVQWSPFETNNHACRIERVYGDTYWWCSYWSICWLLSERSTRNERTGMCMYGCLRPCSKLSA